MKIIKSAAYKKADLDPIDPINPIDPIQTKTPPPELTEEIAPGVVPVGVDQIGPGAIEQPPGITTDLSHWHKGSQNRYYLQVMNVPASPKDPFMKGLGYKFAARFKAWSKEVNDINAGSIEMELSTIGQNFGVPVDDNAMQTIRSIFLREAAEPISETDAKIKSIDKEAPQKEQFAIAKDAVRESLKKLIANIDTPETQDFMDALTNLNNRFYKYSYLNSMMIALQNGYIDKETGKVIPRSGSVTAQWRWEKELGRKVKDEEIGNGCDIFVPTGGGQAKDIFPGIMGKILSVVGRYAGMNGEGSPIDKNFYGFMLSKIARGKKDYAKGGKIYKYYYDYMLNIINKNRLTTVGEIVNYLKGKMNSNEKDEFNIPLKFKIGQAYDMDQTDVIPGREADDPKAEMDRVEAMWLGNNNTPTEKTLSLRDLAVSAAKDGKITINNKSVEVHLGKHTGQSGGWSRGEEIQISDRIAGERELFTLMHELAHSVLHFTDKRNSFSRAEAEVDAEGAAYVIMGHYGFSDNARAYNYLANWTKKEASSKDFIMNRFEPILAAANAIIAGIEEQKMEDYKPRAYAGSWYKRIIKAYRYNKLLKEIRKSGEEAF